MRSLCSSIFFMKGEKNEQVRSMSFMWFCIEMDPAGYNGIYAWWLVLHKM